MARTLLVVDDEAVLREILEYNLVRDGYRVVTAADGREAIAQFAAERPDLVVLDVMLPKLSGLDVCRVIRRDSEVPILMLTAKDSELDRVVGLELGADDYLTKPFSLRELQARIHALLRRTDPASGQPTAGIAGPPSKVPSRASSSGEPANAVRSPGAGPAQVPDGPGPSDRVALTLGAVVVDLPGRRLLRETQALPVTAKAFDLLEFLMRHPGQVFTRAQLLDRVWGYERAVETRTVDTHVHHLRSLIEEEPGQPRFLHTVRGVGYAFRRPPP